MRIPVVGHPWRNRLATVRTWPVRNWVVAVVVVAAAGVAVVSVRNAALLLGTERVGLGTWVRSCSLLASRKDPANETFAVTLVM